MSKNVENCTECRDNFCTDCSDEVCETCSSSSVCDYCLIKCDHCMLKHCPSCMEDDQKVCKACHKQHVDDDECSDFTDGKCDYCKKECEHASVDDGECERCGEIVQDEDEILNEENPKEL